MADSNSLPITVEVPAHREVKIHLKAPEGYNPRLPKPIVKGKTGGHGWLIIQGRPVRREPHSEPTGRGVRDPHKPREPLHRDLLPAGSGRNRRAGLVGAGADRHGSLVPDNQGRAEGGTRRPDKGVPDQPHSSKAPHPRVANRERPLDLRAHRNANVGQPGRVKKSEEEDLPVATKSYCNHAASCGWATGVVEHRCSSLIWRESSSEESSDSALLVIDE